ncbi:hypothetical protein [Rhodobacter capsulatus]|jgi:hypothetical protein|uniref:Conserved domain protein n=1 Tax=Rhodobacter capsulatus (strain ATCC BAA-309 / NBRC 16581 / SB1003) TaxID=272942 RepID=D5APW0_RHOCB|nr:hypothetical protein [Rhodobacter capsulatus]ADE86679.1 conserved domain protein [Rhodobacter capsulatus SB 1003]ETD00543.1 hypothetical protein U714_16175 [Rhodobacter capsulatus DE442]ETD74883.1 hypothetical protein U717_16140 [Rhodobacter capsulatus R121]ETE52623.1 hypothetical protein U715_16130 [Rhodobacter capsulatus Y262]MDS0928480.1 hypothetical protein [Rhodobacter capsulatus]
MRIRLDAERIDLSGLLHDAVGNLRVLEITASPDATVRTERMPEAYPPRAPTDGDDDLPFLIEPAARTQFEAAALSAVVCAINAALHDREIVLIARSGGLPPEVETAVIRALRARSGGFSRPEFKSLNEQVANFARKAQELSARVQAQGEALGAALTASATGHAMTAAVAAEALARDLAAIDHATNGKNGAPRKAWREDLDWRLRSALDNFDADLVARIIDAAMAAVDAIRLDRPETIAAARKNLGEKS